jgi:hypothetical protein
MIYKLTTCGHQRTGSLFISLVAGYCRFQREANLHIVDRVKQVAKTTLCEVLLGALSLPPFRPARLLRSANSSNCGGEHLATFPGTNRNDLLAFRFGPPCTLRRSDPSTTSGRDFPLRVLLAPVSAETALLSCSSRDERRLRSCSSCLSAEVRLVMAANCTEYFQLSRRGLWSMSRTISIV